MNYPYYSYQYDPYINHPDDVRYFRDQKYDTRYYDQSYYESDTVPNRYLPYSSYKNNTFKIEWECERYPYEGGDIYSKNIYGPRIKYYIDDCYVNKSDFYHFGYQAYGSQFFEKFPDPDYPYFIDNDNEAGRLVCSDCNKFCGQKCKL